MQTAVKDVLPGRTVAFHGEPCLVLEHRTDGTLLMTCNQIKGVFGDSNNFAESKLHEHLNGAFLDALTENHTDDVLPRTVDLTALNGSKEYGSVECKVAPLTLDEYRKYCSIIPLPESWEWLSTPWSTPEVNEDDTWVMGLLTNGDLGTDVVFCLGTGGGLGGGNFSRSHGSRPAFLIPSDYAVQAESDDTGNLLEQLGVDEIVTKLADEITAALKKRLNG